MKNNNFHCSKCRQPQWMCEGHEDVEALKVLVKRYRAALEKISAMEDGDTAYLIYTARDTAREALGGMT